MFGGGPLNREREREREGGSGRIDHSESLGIDHVISGPMRGLKTNLMRRGPIHKHTYRHHNLLKKMAYGPIL